MFDNDDVDGPTAKQGLEKTHARRGQDLLTEVIFGGLDLILEGVEWLEFLLLATPDVGTPVRRRDDPEPRLVRMAFLESS